MTVDKEKIFSYFHDVNFEDCSNSQNFDSVEQSNGRI